MGENIVPANANRQDDAHADIHGFWGHRQSAFFDARVFHPNTCTRSYHNSSISAVYRRHEMMKKREYGDRIWEVNISLG